MSAKARHEVNVICSRGVKETPKWNFLEQQEIISALGEVIPGNTVEAYEAHEAQFYYMLIKEGIIYL